MSETEVQDFKTRDLNVLPVAEHFIDCEVPVKKPFHYSVVNVYPLLRVWHKLTQWFS